MICGYTIWTIWLRPFRIESGYVFSYGQVGFVIPACLTLLLTPITGQILALFTAVEPLLQTLVLVYDRRQDIWQSFERFPTTFGDGWVFVLTGDRNPWRQMQEDYIPLDTPPDTAKVPSHSDSMSTIVTTPRTKDEWDKLAQEDSDAR